MKLFQKFPVQKIDNRAGPDIQDTGITLPQMPNIRWSVFNSAFWEHELSPPALSITGSLQAPPVCL